MFKSIGMIVTIAALAFSASAQKPAKIEPPNLRLTLSTEKPIWVVGEPAPVKITIENLSGGKVELPSSVYFTADNRRQSYERVTRANGVFWSPVSLTKTYREKELSCQNDLTPQRVGTLQNTNIVAITPAKDRLILEKGAKKEFSFDLTRVCWNHSISAIYPDQSIFTLAGGHSSRLLKTNIFKVYFEMQFHVGETEDGGRKYPLSKRIKSNEVEITFD